MPTQRFCFHSKAGGCCSTGSDVTFLAHLALVRNLAGNGESPDQPGQEWNQPDGLKPNQKLATGAAPADQLAGGGGFSGPPLVAGSMVQGGDFSPSGDGRSGRGGGQVVPAGATKTIQSYFYKPSNSSAVQNLAASYGTGELAGQTRAASGLPREVDLSGVDEDSHHAEPSHAQPMARVGRSGSTGAAGGSLQHRFSHAVSAAGDQRVGQGQQGHRQVQGRAQGVGSAGAVVESADREPAGSEQETVEKLQDRLREAKALETQLRKELARANLERGSMETMVGRAPHQTENVISVVVPLIVF